MRPAPGPKDVAAVAAVVVVEDAAAVAAVVVVEDAAAVVAVADAAGRKRPFGPERTCLSRDDACGEKPFSGTVLFMGKTAGVSLRTIFSGGVGSKEETP